MITLLRTVTIPVDHLVRIVKIKILFFQYSCQEIRHILCGHFQPKPQKKNSFSFYRCLIQPVIHQCRQLGRGRIHGFGRIGFLKGIYYDLLIHFLWNLRERFFQLCPFINISLQMVAKGHQFHLFI